MRLSFLLLLSSLVALSGCLDAPSSPQMAAPQEESDDVPQANEPLPSWHDVLPIKANYYVEDLGIWRNISMSSAESVYDAWGAKVYAAVLEWTYDETQEVVRQFLHADGSIVAVEITGGCCERQVGWAAFGQPSMWGIGWTTDAWQWDGYRYEWNGTNPYVADEISVCYQDCTVYALKSWSHGDQSINVSKRLLPPEVLGAKSGWFPGSDENWGATASSPESAMAALQTNDAASTLLTVGCLASVTMQEPTWTDPINMGVGRADMTYRFTVLADNYLTSFRVNWLEIAGIGQFDVIEDGGSVWNATCRETPLAATVNIHDVRADILQGNWTGAHTSTMWRDIATPQPGFSGLEYAIYFEDGQYFEARDAVNEARIRGQYPMNWDPLRA